MTSSVAREISEDPRDPIGRLEQLLDDESLRLRTVERNGRIVVAEGRIGGTPVVAYCTDATSAGGSMGYEECRQIAAAIDFAVSAQRPVIGVWHCSGASLTEGVRALDGVGEVFAAMIRASGRVLQLSVIVGPAAGGAAYGAALTDVVVMAPEGRMFVTGPDIVRSATGEQVDMAELGGTAAHGPRSGVAHVVADSEADAYVRARRLVGLFAHPGLFDVTAPSPSEDPSALLPDNPRRAYDVHPIVEAVLDRDSGGATTFEELQARWAPNVVTGVGRLATHSVGVLANNPLRKAGCLDSASAEKAARFVRLCDSLGLPLVVLVDVPGYLPGVREEWGGVLRRGAKLLHAFGEAVVPRVTLITRKSYGGAYIAMNARSLGATRVFAWPTAELAIMDARTAVGLLRRKELAAVAECDRDRRRDELVAELEAATGGVGHALELGMIDEVVDPVDTRRRLAEVLAAAPRRRGEHNNIPL